MLVVIDIYNVAWTTALGMQNLSVHGQKTGVIYNFFRQVIATAKKFRPDLVVFADDSVRSKRKAIFPEYKEARKKRAEDELAEQKLIRKQIRSQIVTTKKWLLMIGFQIFRASGLEADDIIANICLQYPDENIVIVSTDNDLYQLISPTVSIYNARKKELLTLDWFRDTYGIEPPQWAMVKQLAGCHTDSVPGIPGIGEKTALKYLRGELKSTTKAYKKIQEGQEIIERNKKLVALPFEKVPIEIKWVRPDFQKFLALCDEFRFESFKRDATRIREFLFKKP